ncbi:MAG TPA: hypothetical protein VMG36_06595 [Thermoplasmata archaeon]|nr:hypothetical protein [Thermoplasmata archaeon]
MGELHNARAGRRYRHVRRLGPQRRGVAAVVGTLLALLVFFALFGIFLTEYLPLWMADNEAQFTAQASAALAQFKSNIDAQYALGGPPVYATAFPLSSDGVPLLAQPTQATLVLLPPSCPNSFYANGTPETVSACVFERQAFTAGAKATTNNPFNATTASSTLEMQLPNRYYTQQTFWYEDDAVIQSQGGGHEIVTGPPALTISKTGTNVSLTTTYVELYGNATVVIGQGSEEVYSQLVTYQTDTSNGRFATSAGVAVPFNYTMQLGTRNPCAWWQYFTNLTSASGLAKNTYWTLTWSANGATSSATAPTASVCQNSADLTYLVTFKLLNLSYGTITLSSFIVNLGAGAV